MSLNQAKALVKRIGIRGLVTLTVLAVLGGFYIRHEQKVFPLSSDAQGWRALIELKGPEGAYKEFADGNADENAGTRHANAHGFGAGLYAAEGAKGFPVCRDLFEYGCAHGFIVRALQVEGVSAVARFADACRKQPYPGMCLHGIGHGLVSYLGYDVQTFQRSVSICRDIAHDTSTAGCVGGATMEFGLKTMAFGALAVAPITEATKYQPCMEVSTDAKSACYFWLTGWWYSSLTRNEKLSPKDAVVRMGSFCKGMPEQEYTGECFAGMGDNVSMAADYDAKRAIEFCDATTAATSERIYCKAYAENILLGDKRTAPDAPFLCDSEKGDDKDRCDYLTRYGVAVFDAK